MTLKSILRRSTPLVLAGLISTPATAGLIFNEVAEIRDRAPAGNSFNSELAREYKTIALFEADETYDWIDAENHATKGNMAAEGETPLPYTPADWDIDSGADLRELELARAELISILDNGARQSVARQAAVAQAKIDRFVEEMEQIQPVVTLYIAGHADTTGPREYNYELSQRRAAAVRAELERQGMQVGDYNDLRIEAEGETDLAVPTADGVREQRNRRVEIIARGQVTKVIYQTAAVSQ